MLACEQVSVAGVGYGLLSAAAVSCAPNLTELVRLSTDAIRIAFNTALLVDSRTRMVDATEDSSRPWSLLLFHSSEEDTEQVLDMFYNTNVYIFLIPSFMQLPTYLCYRILRNIEGPTSVGWARIR